MLIRLVSHATRRNSNLIDELIRIDGLPEDMVYRFSNGKRYLKSPWEPDIDANIPRHIREHCEPVVITEDLPPERNQVTGELQKPTDTKTILGVRLNLDNNPGKEVWEQITRILEHSIPRDMKIPLPAIVAPNQKDAFSLEAKDIPVVDLRPPKVQPTITVATPAVVQIQPVVAFNPPKAEEPIQPVVFTCGVCKKSFEAQRGLWMHERKTRHKVKEAVAVGG